MTFPCRAAGCLTLSLIALLLSQPATSAEPAPPCATDKAASVLNCLSAAFNTRDIAAFDHLLASDYTFHNERLATTDPDRGWTRDQHLKGVTDLLAGEGVRSIQLTITRHGRAKATGPNTWVIPGIVTDLRVIQSAHPDHPLDVHTEGTTLRVRRVLHPKPHFEIYEWIEPMQ